MCGIFGYVGTERSVPVTVGRALKSLEYRGYDSWGIVWRSPVGLKTVKQTGKVPTQFTFDALSRIAIGHTRWATHGGVTETNAHPHLDPTGRIAIVHNGIVENAAELRPLVDSASPFRSETDSEVVAHLLGLRVAAGSTLVEAMREVFPLLAGQNAVIAIDQDDDVIAAAMNISPLVVASGPEGSFISSDPFALAGKAREMIVAPAEAVLVLDAGGITAIAFDGTPLPLPDPHPVPDVSVEELGPFRHFMAREMADQSEVLRRQIADEHSNRVFGEALRQAETVILTGCGSAFYAARIGAHWLGKLARKRVMVVPASEIAEAQPFFGPESLVVAVSQSGETADVLEAVRTAQASGTPVCALVNVEHSSLARMVDTVVPLLAGRERSVLATKSMTAMLGRFLLGSGWSAVQQAEAAASLARAAGVLEWLSHSADVEGFVARVAGAVARSEHVFVIGKGLGAGIGQEAALKIKEASYVHAEAFAAGELKHGAIALIEPGVPCLLFAPESGFVRDLDSSAQELHSRGGYTFGIGIDAGGGMCDGLSLPDAGSANAIVQVVVAQRIAYQTALLRNLDPDYPRNLAKSVTVK